MFHIDKFYPEFLQGRLHESYTDGFLCDVTLIVDGLEFNAHKIVLSAASPYFRAMFNPESSFIEAKQNKVNLFGINSYVMSEILVFIYTSRIYIDNQNVYSLMAAANLLQIHALRMFITYHLYASLTIYNCVTTYTMACLHEYHDLAKNAFHFLLSNFNSVYKANREAFMNLSYEVLLKIVSSRLLDIESEVTLCELVLEWISCDFEKRKSHLDSLMSKIDLHSVSKEELSKLKLNPLVSAIFRGKIEKLTKIPFSSSNSVIMFGRGNIITSQEEKYSQQKFRYKEEKVVIFVIGGDCSGMASKSVECFIQGYDKWRYVVPECIIRQEIKHTKVLAPLRCARFHAASAHDDYNVYVVGGRNSTSLLDECEVYDVRTNQWNCFLSLPVKLYGSGAAFLDGELFVLGGLTEKEVLVRDGWRLDRGRKKWTPIRLRSRRFFHAVVTTGGFIFAMGGYTDPQDSAVSTCERFDPNCDEWIEVAPMCKARAKFGAVASGAYIYVFGGTTNEIDCLNSAEIYNIITNEWSNLPCMPVPRHSFSVLLSGWDVYCLGGSDGIHCLDSVEKYNCRTKRWHCAHSMQVSRIAPAGASLLVPYLSKE